jgi:hypothetical protein
MTTDEPHPLGTDLASVRLLNSLVDGELDVDRSDYLLRDARSYGFDYITFDLERLASSLTVHEDGDGRLSVAILARGQPAAESFLFARYRIYQWGVFQHKVVQVGAALQLVSRELLEGVFSAPTHRYHGFVSEIAALADPDPDGARVDERAAALETFALHDDVWWLGELRAHAPKSPIRDLVLARKPGPVSLWKRVSGFPDGRPAVEALNRHLPARGDLAAEKTWRRLVRQVREENGVVLNRVRFTPVQIDKLSGVSLLRVGDSFADSQPLSELSPLIAGLVAAWASDLQVFAYSERPIQDPAALADTICSKMMATISNVP